MDSLPANLDSPRPTASATPDSSSVFRSRAIGRLFAPVDIASLAVFRVLFGAAMVQEAVRYAMMGWISEYYIDPKFYFTYYGFEWVKPWAGKGMYLHFGVMGLAALGVMLGAWYRICAMVLFITFTHVF